MRGLKIITDAITQEYADLILASLPHEFVQGCDSTANLQLHHFRPVPEYITMISEDAIPQDFKDDTWNGCETDCAIVQRYAPGSGIDWHTDLDKFGDGIAILSLLSSVVMQFRQTDNHTITESILLPPRSLLLCSGPARYDWEHRIAAVENDSISGQFIARKTRISITMRIMSES